MTTDSSVPPSKLLDSDAYRCISLTQDGFVSGSSQSYLPSFDSYFYDGVIAVAIGLILASFGWVATQGWTLVTFRLLGHVSFAIRALGYLCTIIAFETVTKLCFVLEDDDDDNREGMPYEQDIVYELKGLCEFGFVVGYLLSHAFFTNLFYKPFDIEFDPSAGFYEAFVVCTFLWALRTKMGDYNRAQRS